VLQSEERQDREAQKNAHADAQAEVAGVRGFEHGEAENNQQGAERRDESPEADLAKHTETLTHAMTAQGYNTVFMTANADGRQFGDSACPQCAAGRETRALRRIHP
jgi:predicted ArsR family transcriptional regulator